MKLTKLQEAIVNLLALQSLIREYVNELRKTENSIVKSALTSQILILICSYIDEWEYVGDELKDDATMQKLRKYSKPAFSEIRKWKDLQNYRNTWLAHNLRGKQNSFLLLNNYFELKIPYTIPDLILAEGLLHIVNQALISEFVDDYNIAIETINSNKPIFNRKGLNSIEEAGMLVIEIAAKMDALKKTIL